MKAAEENMQQVKAMLKKMGMAAKDLPEPTDEPQPLVSVPRQNSDEGNSEPAGKILKVASMVKI